MKNKTMQILISIAGLVMVCLGICLWFYGILGYKKYEPESQPLKENSRKRAAIIEIGDRPIIDPDGKSSVSGWSFYALDVDEPICSVDSVNFYIAGYSMQELQRIYDCNESVEKSKNKPFSNVKFYGGKDIK